MLFGEKNTEFKWIIDGLMSQILCSRSIPPLPERFVPDCEEVAYVASPPEVSWDDGGEGLVCTDMDAGVYFRPFPELNGRSRPQDLVVRSFQIGAQARRGWQDLGGECGTFLRRELPHLPLRSRGLTSYVHAVPLIFLLQDHSKQHGCSALLSA